MSFAEVNLGAQYDLSLLKEKDSAKVLFNENIALVFQADASVESVFVQNKIEIVEGFFITLSFINNDFKAKSGLRTFKNDKFK